MTNELNTDILRYPDRMMPERSGFKPQAGSVQNAASIVPLLGDGKILPLEAAREAKEERLDKAVSSLNEYVQAIRRELRFSIDEATGRTVITVYDSDTNQIVRQIPPEEVMMLAKHLGPGKGAVLRANI